MSLVDTPSRTPDPTRSEPAVPSGREGAAGAGPLPPPRSDELPPPVGAFRYVRQPTVRPGGFTGRDPVRHAVAIAGGGPVGMALALGLANFGVRSVVIEADDTVCVGSRAACISRRSLEIVERLGALPAFLAKGLPWSGGRSFYKTDEVFRFEMPHDPGQKLPPMINLEQYYIEQYLLEAIERRNREQPGCIDIRWGSELVRVDARADGVALAVRDAQGEYALDADWLAACDGGQSFVRRSLGLALEGTAYEGRYVIIDIELASRHPTERRAWFDPPWNPGSTVLMHRQPDDIWRIDYQLRPGQSTEEALELPAVQAFVQRHLDAIGEGHLPWKTVWRSVYRAGAMTLGSYRHDRVLFAGNAAHAMPIFGVRGLNSGFDDADNLAWKLAFVARGAAGPALLDSYSQERIAAFHVNAENAMRSTEFMSPPSRGFDLLREAALSLAARHRGIANLINPRQTEAVRYADSSLSTTDGGHPGGPLPGQALPEQALGGAGHLSDRLGPWFSLLLVGEAARGPARAAADAWLLQLSEGPARPRLVMIDAAPGRESALQALGATPGAVVLVRPDGHVAARWSAFDAIATQAALERACGKNPARCAETAA